MNRPFRIYIGILESFGYSRQVLRGIQRYSMSKPHQWWFARGDINFGELAAIESWAPDGMILQLSDIALEQPLLATGIPCVNVSTRHTGYRIPTIGPDNYAAGAMGAAHLFECGLRHLAFWPQFNGATASYRIERKRGLMETAARLGVTFHDTPAPARTVREQEARLFRWLRGLPKPVGFMTSGDSTAVELIEACRIAGILVPEEIAVLGIGDETFDCELAPMPLSSVTLPGERVGYEALVLLEQLLSGAPAPADMMLLPPLGVTMRTSTRPNVLDDPYVETVLRYIYNNASSKLTIATVAALVPLSRRSLELRFRQQRGHTMREEIHLACVMRSKVMLLETDLTVEAIAAATGFADSSHLVRIFHKIIGITPQSFRRQARGG